MFEQATMQFGIAARQDAFDLLGGGNNQSQRMAMEGFLDARDVDDAKQISAQRIKDSAASAPPG